MFVRYNSSSILSQPAGEAPGSEDNRSELDLGYLEIWYAGPMYTLRGVCLLVFTTFGTLLNCFMLIAIIPNRRLRTARHILLAHLAILGLVTSLLTNLYTAVVSLLGQWHGGAVVCHIYGFVNSTLTLVTIWTIVTLSYDKYQTIATPLHHPLTATMPKIITYFAVLWCGSLIVSLPPLFGASEYKFNLAMGICALTQSNVIIVGQIYTCCLLIATFYLPLIMMLYFYSHIFKIARSQSSRIAATMVQMLTILQAPLATSQQPKNVSIQGTKAMGTIMQVLGALIIVYIPYSVLVLLQQFLADENINSIAVSVITSLFQAAPVVNGVVYGLRNKLLRSSFFKYVRRKVQHACVKDQRRGSVKSLSRRSSSFRMLSNGRSQSGPLRRTQSFPARPPGSRAAALGQERREGTEQRVNGAQLGVRTTGMSRHQSFIVRNGGPMSPVNL